MKEKIYTIPVTEAFQVECECSLCVLEKKLEDEYIEYILGPSLMEPDGRIETNNNGFCRRHFELLYNKQENKLGLGLIIDTHMVEQNNNIKKIYELGKKNIAQDENSSFMKNISSKVSSKQTEGTKAIDKLIEELDKQEKKCTICNKLNYTTNRYYEVVYYLWFKEQDFRDLFNNKKGFCQKHFKQLLIGARKNLNLKETSQFCQNLIDMQTENLTRIQDEVNWFTKKFDYRYNDEPWKNSRDSLIRSIQKLVSYCNLK